MVTRGDDDNSGKGETANGEASREEKLGTNEDRSETYNSGGD